MNHINKKESKLELPKSTNSDVLLIKKRIRRLKLEMTRNPSLEFNEYLQEDLKYLSNYLLKVRQLESDYVAECKEETNKGRKKYQLRRYKDQLTKDFEIDNWIFSRKFLRKFGIDKGITIEFGDIYEKISEPSDLKYRLVTVAEEPETTGLVVVMRSYKANDVSGKNKSVFVELGDFVNNFILFAVSTPDFEDYTSCEHCGEFIEI